jgi:hypothetical protein
MEENLEPSRYEESIMWNPPIALTPEEQKIAARTQQTRKFFVFLIHAAGDLASFLRYPLGQFFTSRGRRDAADQADGHRASATGTNLQNDR